MSLFMKVFKELQVEVDIMMRLGDPHNTGNVDDRNAIKKCLYTYYALLKKKHIEILKESSDVSIMVAAIEASYELSIGLQGQELLDLMLETKSIVEMLNSVAVTKESKSVALYFGFKLHQFIGVAYYNMKDSANQLLELRVAMKYWRFMYDLDRYGNGANSQVSNISI